MQCICLRQFLGPFQTIVHICSQPVQIQMLMHNLQQRTIAVSEESTRTTIDTFEAIIAYGPTYHKLLLHHCLPVVEQKH